ncbi:MAG TPA: sodium:calcium antiporter [Candidatus Bathyarchaeota archaeon]|nr:sodium:calcium antiporter [Candidatus Bathyarchaeota archaeon]
MSTVYTSNNEMTPILLGVIFAASLALLAKASHLTIASIEDLIELTGLSEASAGFIILSVMTSVPEMTVAVFSVLQGTPGISIGDILGSNMFNIGIVVGIMVMIAPLERVRSDFLTEMVDILFLSSAIPLLLVVPFFSAYLETVRHLIGAFLIGIFILSIYVMAKARRVPPVKLKKEETNRMNKRSVFMKVVGGTAIVVLAARLTVWSASNIAASLGVPPILIGAKIVAIGTSLPELALDVTAARRGRIRLAIGDAIGSNLSNMTLILGFVLLTSPFAVDLTIFTEILPFLLIITLLLWRFLTKGGIPKWGGVMLIMVYVIFQATITGL